MIKYPEDTTLGQVESASHFESACIKDGLMEDLMDRTDLEPGHFFAEALRRANQIRSTHPTSCRTRWVLMPKGHYVILVKAEFIPAIDKATTALHTARNSVALMEDLLHSLLTGGSKP